MDWLHPTYLITLLAVPCVVALFLYGAWRRRNSLRQFGDTGLVSRLSTIVSARRRRYKAVVFICSIGLLAVALAGPRFGTKLREAKREGVDLVIALDVSTSMFAEDVLPNRLTRAKYEIERLIDRLEGDRVGLILFAGDAFIQCPLTLDYSAVRLFLDIASPSQIPTPGTDFGAALRRAVQVLSGAGREPGEGDRTRALLIVSDGENHAEVETALAIAREANLVMFAAGVGEDTGTPIPEFRNGRRVGFKKDQDDNTVLTKLEEETLQRLASDGGYFRVTRTSSSMLEMIDALKRLDRRAFEREIFEEYDEKYQWPLAFGLLLLVIEMLARDHRRKPREPQQ